ncbi:hypothetical protein [Janibacter melonis]|uniref:hypothetical protein n=1 Tax=Janibacter melonis TaxID=262209 RepID=UPI001783C58D|nr:hypothetical protein [Janibacter melonis]
MIADRSEGRNDRPLAGNEKRDRQLEQAGRWLLDHPAQSIGGLLFLAFTIEVAQAWSEWLPGGHAVGEIVRNLAYALVGALLFNWLVVKIPDERRQRSAYQSHEMAFKVLVLSAVGPLGYFRGLLEGIGDALGEDLGEVDAHDKARIWAAAETLRWHAPQVFSDHSDMFGTFGSAVMGAQVSLEGLAASTSFFHPDVAHALGTYPATTGLQQLQLPPADADLDLRVNRSAHIVWHLLEGGRRLVAALDEHAPYLDLEIDEMVIEVVMNGKRYQPGVSGADVRAPASQPKASL